MNDKATWTVHIEEDKDTGDLLLPFPVDLLSQMGWSEGTDLFWIDNHNGSFTITDKKPEKESATPNMDDDVGC
jgi:hypothetical protein